MPFESGTFSFSMCLLPIQLGDDFLQRFAAYRAHPVEAIGSEPEPGWVSGRHLLETRIDDETSIMGGYPFLNLRMAQRKIPPSLLSAECKIRELAYLQAEKKDYLTRKQRKEIKQEVEQDLINEMPPTLKGTAMVIDRNRGLLYVGATSPNQVEAFVEAFGQAQKFEPLPLTADALAEMVFDVDPDALPILQFSAECAPPGDEPTLGRDFLTWVWYFIEEEGARFTCDELGDFFINIEAPVTFSTDPEPRDALESMVRKGGTRCAEARAAMIAGRKLRRAKFTISEPVKEGKEESRSWTFVLDADTFSFRGVSLPSGEKLEPHSAFQERMYFINTLREAINRLFEMFLEEICDEARMKALAKRLNEWVSQLASA